MLNNIGGLNMSFKKLASQLRDYVEKRKKDRDETYKNKSYVDKVAVAVMTHVLPRPVRDALRTFKATNTSAMSRLSNTSRKVGVSPANLTRINPAAGAQQATQGIWDPQTPARKTLVQNFTSQIQNLPLQEQRYIKQNPSDLQRRWLGFLKTRSALLGQG